MKTILSAPQPILGDVIGSLELSLQIVSECLKTIVGYFALLSSFFPISQEKNGKSERKNLPESCLQHVNL